MRYILSALILCLVHTSALGQACTADTSNTEPTETGRGLPASADCFDCRDLSQFPRDFRNSAWNYVQYGDAAFTFANYHNTLTNGFSDSSTMVVRTCNDFGQCANTHITVNFDTTGLGTIAGVPVQIRTAVNNYSLVTSTSDGPNRVAVIYPGSAGDTLKKVPAGSKDDGRGTGDCMNNEGELTDGSTGGGDGGGGGSGGGNNGPPPDPLPGDTGDPVCGISRVDDGKGRRTCD